MTPEQFLRRLDDASERAIAFARELVVDRIPDARLYDLIIVPHHDGRVNPPLVNGRRSDVKREDVVNELLHDGRVPEWIDISVQEVGAPPDDLWNLVTFIELRCSRTLVDETGLWYGPEGVPPFHVQGPNMPPDFEHRAAGAKYTLQRSGRRHRRP